MKLRIPRGKRRHALGRDIAAFLMVLATSDLLWLISNQAIQGLITWSNTLPNGTYDTSTFNFLNVAWTWWPVLNLVSLGLWIIGKAILRRLVPYGGP